MGQNKREQPMTDEEIDDVAAAADELGERVVNALAAETGRDAEEFDVDPDDYEFPGSDS
jgi:hypothetical protein